MPRRPWSFAVGSLFGVPIRVHATFLVLAAWIAMAPGEAGVGAALVFVLVLFASVVLHELGHAVVAWRHGFAVREIVLYPIGGFSRLDGVPSGFGELAISLAGPAVNLGVAIGAVVGMTATGTLALPQSPEQLLAPGGVLPLLFFANVGLFAVNLLPAFPMDGGRILRSLLSLVLPEARATSLTGVLGQVLALLFVGLGLLPGGSPAFLFLALFVFLGATHESAIQRQRVMARGRPASDAMITDFAVLAPQDPLARAGELFTTTAQRDFPVVDAWGRLSGLLGRAELVRGLARHGAGGAVLEAMRREVAVVPPTATLEQALLAGQGQPGVPVLVGDEEGIVGMIPLDAIAELLEVRRLLGGEG